MDESKQISDQDLMEQFFRLTRVIGRYQLRQFHHFGPFSNPHRGQGRVLSILKLKEEITQKELGYLLDMRNQSLGELLGKLEKSGYITRTPSEEDKRTTIIKLTEAGTAAAEAAGSGEERVELFDCLNDEEKAALGSYLERINAALEQLSEREPHSEGKPHSEREQYSERGPHSGRGRYSEGRPHSEGGQHSERGQHSAEHSFEECGGFGGRGRGDFEGMRGHQYDHASRSNAGHGDVPRDGRAFNHHSSEQDGRSRYGRH
jgi:DNA-binding MarR family transcriptional regulator